MSMTINKLIGAGGSAGSSGIAISGGTAVASRSSSVTRAYVNSNLRVDLDEPLVIDDLRYQYWMGHISEWQYSKPRCPLAKFLREVPRAKFDFMKRQSAGGSEFTQRYMNVRMIPLLGFLCKLELYK